MSGNPFTITTINESCVKLSSIFGKPKGFNQDFTIIFNKIKTKNDEIENNRNQY